MKFVKVLSTTAIASLLSAAILQPTIGYTSEPIGEVKESIVIEAERIHTELELQDSIEEVGNEMLETIEVEEELLASNPKIVPGDFFYFLKITFEKIQLALTFNDSEKAKLLTQFAQERIAEADRLLNEENIEEAEMLLEKALEQFLLAVDHANDETIEIVDERELLENQDELEEDKEVEENKNDDPLNDKEEMELVFSQSVISLMKNLEKVENPRAKEALQRNIERKLQKLNNSTQLVDKEELVGSEEKIEPIVVIPEEVAEVELEEEITSEVKETVIIQSVPKVSTDATIQKLQITSETNNTPVAMKKEAEKPKKEKVSKKVEKEQKKEEKKERSNNAKKDKDESKKGKENKERKDNGKNKDK